VLDINAAQCSLPHDRERVFIEGVTAELTAGPWGLKWPAVSGRTNAQRPSGEFVAAERRLPRARLSTPKIRGDVRLIGTALQPLVRAWAEVARA
jgi:site-specific DNA-cytosine methylase